MANTPAGDYSKPYSDTSPFYVGDNTSAAQGGIASQFAIPDATRKIAAMKKLMQVNYDNASAKSVNDLSPLGQMS